MVFCTALKLLPVNISRLTNRVIVIGWIAASVYERNSVIEVIKFRFIEFYFHCCCIFPFTVLWFTDNQVFDLIATEMNPSLKSLEVQAATMYTTYFPQRSVAVCVVLYCTVLQ